jgi:hypothetical protein
VHDAVVLDRPLQGANDVVLTAKFDESTRAESAIERRDAVDGRRGGRRVSHPRMLTVRCKCRGPKQWSGDPWHPTRFAESCWLPPLTRFTNGRRTGPDHRFDLGVEKATGPVPSSGSGSLASRYSFQIPGCRPDLEECESGRIGTIGNRVKGNLPWVQIPPPPPEFDPQTGFYHEQI